jgi:hypothetical protein|tara:strand:+ start:302 stop:448 length:147 start_codon:yes stop_codon:yes gene_type:complete
MDKQTNNTHLLNIVIQLTRIADELEKARKKKEEEEKDLFKDFNYGGTA